MTGAAETTLAAVKAVQLILTALQNSLEFGSHWCPVDASMDTIRSTTYDYIIVGAGASGSVLASRLTECSNKNVLLLEAGGCPPLESLFPGYFTLLPKSANDYNIPTVNDNYSCQGLQGNVVGVTIGKMLGGSNSLHHMLWVRGAPADYDRWVDITGDCSWSYSALQPYFKKAENVQEITIIAENGTVTGTSGPIKLKKQCSSENDGIFEALAELGYTKLNNINTADNVFGVVEPLLMIGEKFRSGGSYSYIHAAQTRSNLHVLTNATVTKINFDSSNAATGVTFTYGGSSYTVSASNEVILAAGAIKTPQLLMLSGIGPKSHLEDKGITVISDVPVGQNLMDHVTACTIFTLENDNSTTPGANPFDFPVPITTSYKSFSRGASFPTFNSINLVFPHDSSGLRQFCSIVLKYNSTICDAMAAANTGKKVMLSAQDNLHPVSTGQILLSTTSIEDQPLIYLGLLSNITDLENLAFYMEYYAKLVNTTYFKSVGAEIADLGVCADKAKYTNDYWKCYALALSSTFWHYSGTAAMGSVVDTNLLVKGVYKLRIVDASVIPYLTGGKLISAVIGVAEKISDVIKSGITCCA